MRLPFLRRLQFQGELHDIHLVNFSVDAAELRGLLPAPLRLRTWEGRALVSMVDVRLCAMRATDWWLPFRFGYQHIGFRVLVEDGQWNDDRRPHGIYFLRSFTDRPAVAWAGNLVGSYRLEQARLVNHPGGLQLFQGDRYLRYATCGLATTPGDRVLALKTVVGGIDRAWAVEDGRLQKTQIVREKWPLQPLQSTAFATNFFESARLEGIFKVPETIHYTWLPPQPIALAPHSEASPIYQPSYA